MTAQPEHETDGVLVGAYEFEPTRGGYTVWHFECLIPIAHLSPPERGKITVAMERSGKQFRSRSLEDAAETIACLYCLGL